MNTKLRLLLSGCFVALTPATSPAQSIGPASINPSGGSAQVATDTYEYAVGQLTPGQTASAGGIIITPEVLQPRIQSTGMIEQVSESAVRVFPNPTSSSLFLKPSLLAGTELRYVLYDASGKVVARSTATLSQGTEQQTLQVETLSPGMYNLRVSWTSGGNPYEAGFKIQKQ